MSSTNGSHLLRATGKVSITVFTDHPIDDRMAGKAASQPSSETPNSDAPALMDVLESTDNTTLTSRSANPSPILPLSDSSTDVTTVEAATISPSDTSNNETVPQGVAPPIEASSADCVKMTVASPRPNEYTSVKRPVLDESGSSLESVFIALKTQNTDRIPDFVISDKYSELTKTDSMTFVRIISGIGLNCVNSILVSLASALEVEKLRLREYE
jgi:hypothetical protein